MQATVVHIQMQLRALQRKPVQLQHRTLQFRQVQVKLGHSAQTGPSAAQASVVQIVQELLLSRHVQVQLRFLCCGVDTPRSSTCTDLSSVDTSICSSGPCGVDTSTGAGHKGYFCPDTYRCSLCPCTVVQTTGNIQAYMSKCNKGQR